MGIISLTTITLLLNLNIAEPETFPQSPISTVNFSKDGKILGIGFQTGEVVIWDVPNRSVKTTFIGHTSNVTNLILSPDGTKCCSCDLNGRSLLWKTATGQLTFEFILKETQINTITVSPDWKNVLTGSSEGIAQLWNIKNDRALPARTLSYPKKGEWATFAGGGDYLVFAGVRDWVYVESIDKGEKYFAERLHNGLRTELIPISNNAIVSTAISDHHAVYWDFSLDKKVYIDVGENRGGIVGGSSTSDGMNLLMLTESGDIILWDRKTQKINFIAIDKLAHSVCVSGDGRFFAIVKNHRFSIWDLKRKRSVYFTKTL